ncbi:hypothetical protein QTO34_008205 [Cnephaeus nilssonii]|uniref:Uncharacterized protein n=1 Tax=Cnephaeus nilssonii TaxID=3371016 RepID=A0AA40IAT6_CNENI|nr:hypothetical protein QTO34_008205 [Eptesicus nilssonii]
MVEQVSGRCQAKAGMSGDPIALVIAPQMLTSGGGWGCFPGSQVLREPGGGPGPNQSSRRQDGEAEGAEQPIWVPERYVHHHNGPREAPCPFIQKTESCPDDSKVEKEDDEGYAKDRGANMGSAEEVNS